jgi:hypothetical protein
MDYVEWCELVLRTIAHAGDESAEIRNYGITEESLAQRVWGQNYARLAEHLKTQESADIFYDAVFDLYRTLLVDDPNSTFTKLTRNGRNAAKDIFPVWENACLIRIEPVMENALKIVNRHSHQPNQYFGRVMLVPTNTVHCELDDEKMTEEDVWEVLGELKNLGLVYWDGDKEPDEIRANYRGLLWETRRDQVIGARFIDSLVTEWETTSVEFKRELHLDAADQKAEFIKDVIGLGNTQASGQRWMIVGFDDKTRAYYAPPDPAVTQNRIENILAEYTAPNLEVRYETIAYKGGLVGRLEVFRDPKKLPYKVARSLGNKSLGDKKPIRIGQVFVRHGSQTEEPTAAELQAIQEEAARARQ